VSKRFTYFFIIYGASIICLILSLNFNVRTFRLTQELQGLTINLQELENEVALKELQYYEMTRLDEVYRRAEALGMMRPHSVRHFTNNDVLLR
jgi:hypothetical protein